MTLLILYTIQNKKKTKKYIKNSNNNNKDSFKSRSNTKYF